MNCTLTWLSIWGVYQCLGGCGREVVYVWRHRQRPAYCGVIATCHQLIIIPSILNADLDSRRSILDRIQKGGSLAALKVKLIIGSEPVAVKLADLRRDRGIEKRVVIVAAEKELLRSSVQSSMERSASLLANDLLIVPLLIERGVDLLDYSLAAPSIETLADGVVGVDHIAVPLAISSWNEVMKREFQSALKQQPDALLKGDGSIDTTLRKIDRHMADCSYLSVVTHPDD